MKRKRHILKILLFAGGFFLWTGTYSQESLRFHFDDHYTITERHDIRQRVNGRYKGFIYREWRGVLGAAEFNGPEVLYTGSFYEFRKMTRNLSSIAKVIDDVIPASFSIDSYGRIKAEEGAYVPPVQNIPVLPDKPVKTGDIWRSYGIRVVDPKGGHPTRVSVYCEYRYEGLESTKGGDRHRIRGQYALRYRNGDDPYGDPELKETHGKHILDIYIPVGGDSDIFMRDTVQDQYYYSDGTVIEESGAILTWFDDVSGMDRESLIEKVERITAQDGNNDITVSERPEGLLLQIQNIHFYPDEDRILPDQENKISTIARILREASGHMFLVTGHTADIGTAESQQILSEKRAKVVVDMLEGMGIPAANMIYQGKGGTEPIAPNDIEENRAKNRRVEITILEGEP